MIHCPQCDISFSPGYETCPKCKNFAAPRLDRVRYLKRKAEEFASNNASKADVRAYLIDKGLTDIEADDAIASAVASAARESRSFGCLRMLTGAGMLFLGCLTLLTLALTFRDGSTLLLGGRTMVLFVIVGGGMTIGGILAIVLGLFSTTTGRS